MELYILIGIGVVILVLLFVYLLKRAAEKKTKILQELAVQMEGIYSKDVSETFKSRLNSFILFTKPCKYSFLSHLVQATTGGIERAVFEFHSTVEGKAGLTEWLSSDVDRPPDERYEYTVLYLRSDKLNLPQFILTKHGFWDGISSAFGLQKDINIESHKNFSDSYSLRGADEPAIRNLFNGQIISYFENNWTFSAEGHGQEMIIYCDKLMTDDIQPFMEKGIEAFNLFQRNHTFA